MTDYAHGSCYCGKIKFKVALPVIWQGHCHCTQCQRVHGAAFVTWVAFDTEDVHIEDPKNCYATYQSEISTRGFCKACGSSFHFKYHAHAPEVQDGMNWVYFTRANITTKLQGLPSGHFYFDTRAPWCPFEDNLPRFGAGGVEVTE